MKSCKKLHRNLVFFIKVCGLFLIHSVVIADVPDHFSYQGFISD